MAFESEKRVAAHLLSVVEDGTLEVRDAGLLFEDADPALVYLIFAWLRDRYTGHSAAEGVLGRIVGILQVNPRVAKLMKTGEKDPLVEWFEETWDYRELDRDAFISLVVDKLEG